MKPIALALASAVFGIAVGLPFGTVMERDREEARRQSIVTEEGRPMAFSDINARMHGAMTFPPSGSMDLDFARGMIAHHQGAIDMAREELAEGDDPRMRRLAQDIVSAQEREISLMRAWMAERGRSAPATDGTTSSHMRHH